MIDPKELKPARWIFFVGDLLLVGVACVIYYKSDGALLPWQAGLLVVSVALGAFVAVLPFVLEYLALGRLSEAERLAQAVADIQNMEKVAEQISTATGRWQSVQEVADRVAATSRAIAERMSTEARAFTEFMQRANDQEKAALQLEADKLRRAEGDWLQVLVRIMDHVYALHLGATRSGQPKLIAQLDQFQHACRDAARRIGLTPFVANPAEPFDSQRHQVLDGDEAASVGGTIAETLATGYTFQGRLVRPALVRLQRGNGDPGSKELADQALPKLTDPDTVKR